MEEGVNLSSVHAARPHAATARRGILGRDLAFDRPGERVEILWRDDAAPACLLGVFFVPIQPGRLFGPVYRDCPLTNVGGGDRRRDAFCSPDALALEHRLSHEGFDLLCHCLCPPASQIRTWELNEL